ncbi:MAG: hypothetical protein ACKVP3_14925 [Hyphomicrobiaceae bacterium]
MVIMTPATSVSFFRSEFDDFLYAAIGADRNESPLSVLSALARLNLDPWQEAAELSQLPKGIAAARLEKLIARLPRGRWAEADLGAIADRLIALLPSIPSAAAQVSKDSHGRRMASASVREDVLAWIRSLFRR